MTPRRTWRTALALAAVALAAALATIAWQETAPPRTSEGAATDAAAPAAPRGGPIELLLTGDDDGYLDACGCDEGLLVVAPRGPELAARHRRLPCSSFAEECL